MGESHFRYRAGRARDLTVAISCRRITIPPSWSNVSTMMRAQTKEEAHAHAVHLEGLSKLLFQLSSLRDDKVRSTRY